MQSLSSGIALGWFKGLHVNYKYDCSAFLSAFKKQFTSQKTAYCAQVEAHTLTKKEIETIRHYGRNFRKLVEKA